MTNAENNSPQLISRGILSLLTGVAIACSVASALFTSLYLLGQFGSDGFSMSDYIITAVLSIVLLMMISAMNIIGIRVIPFIQSTKRHTAFFLWLAGVVFIAGYSGLTSLEYIAGPSARSAENSSLIEDAQASFNEKSEAIASVDAFIPVITTVGATARSMETSEDLTGAISGTSGGIGRTTAELRSLVVAGETALAQLIDARADSQPLIREGRVILSQLRMVEQADHLSFNDRSTRIRELVSRLSAISEELDSLIPVVLLRDLSDALSKNWRRAGLSAEASRKMKETYSLQARRIAADLAPLEEVMMRPIPQILETEGLALIAKHSSDLGSLIALCVLTELLPLFIALIVMLITSIGRDEDQNQNKVSAEPSSYGAQERADHAWNADAKQNNIGFHFQQPR